MVELYLGSVGSGKSYHALVRGLSKISCWPDRYVVANFPIRFSKNVKRAEREKQRWLFLEDDQITPEKLIGLSVQKDFIGKEGYALLIIDEAGIKFNSRDWQIKGEERKKWIKFFSQSRKFGYDVILIAQDERMVDRQIRAAAEYRVMHRLANRFSWFKFLPVKMFFYVSFWCGGNFRGRLEIDFLKPWLANRYDTMRLFEVAAGATEQAGEGLGVPSRPAGAAAELEVASGAN